MNSPAKTPISIPTSRGSLSGWLHVPQSAGDAALLICNPFGYEAVCAHRALRVLAEQAAQAGVTTARFDYQGTGDSGEPAPGTEEIPGWQRNVVEAATWLKAVSGCTRLFLLGVRLGATLARLAADELTGIAGLIAIEPVVSGRRYLRELGAWQGAFGASIVDLQDVERQDQALGYRLSDTLRTSLAAVDLMKVQSSPPSRILVLDRSHLRLADKWIAALQQQPCSVQRVEADEYEAMMVDPHKGALPHDLIKTCVNWIAPAAQTVQLDAAIAIPTAAQTDHGECVVSTRADRDVWGVLTRPWPAPASDATPAIILLNSGAIHHVGPNRLYVQWARDWARLGVMTLRVDLSGIGDSPVRHPDADNTVYSRNALEDVKDAVQFLRAQPGVSEVHLMGLCSGAYHALQAAEQGSQIDGIVMINPLTYFWDYDDPMPSDELLLAKQVIRNRNTGMSLRRLQTILRDPARLARTARFTVKRGRQVVAQRVTTLARRLHIPTRNDLGSILRQLVKRGVRVHLVFSANDPGRELLRIQGAPLVDGLLRRGDIGCEIIAGADHTFTLLRHQAELSRHLKKYVGSLKGARADAELLTRAG